MAGKVINLQGETMAETRGWVDSIISSGAKLHKEDPTKVKCDDDILNAFEKEATEKARKEREKTFNATTKKN